ncbi:MAG: LysM peptidoglycan-binding domain-containing protein [Anaerolineaceae bacterium]|nr:LysM peptidoglycan-binding domain-containing protein [Anaerolineaceae bacterium]
MQKALKRTLIPLLALILLLMAPSRIVQAQTGVGVLAAEGRIPFNLNAILSDSDIFDDPNTGDDTTIIAQETEPVIYPVATVTPNEDGIIIHTVKYGETLWDISQTYGVPIETILANSNISLETTAVYEGQTLIIQKATVPTATATPTPTEDPGTPTPTQPRATMTPYPTRTPAPTQEPTRGPSIITQALSNGKSFGIGLVAICAVGLGALLYFGFLKKS